MKRFLSVCSVIALSAVLFCSCGKKSTVNATAVILSDNGVIVNGNAAPTQSTAPVYVANDIVYYQAGHDFKYGEGSEADAHTAEEAAAHTVVHITKAGTYRLSGKLSAGQIAVDLGEDAKDDATQTVTLLLDSVDITCTVAPAILFYRVYECGSDKEKDATQTVDTTAAGANIVLADGSQNNISGSYVARIYESYTLNEEGTEVIESKKLHKYDGAVYSKMSMNVGGQQQGTGVLNITAENEGLDSELHLTVNGGTINIVSENDGINTNEDNVSVTTVNGGTLNIQVSPTAKEGDGIDSNGWLVINGGTVTAFACGTSADAGIDSDKGIYINGGTVTASGNMLDRIDGGEQTFAVFSFAKPQKAGNNYILKSENGSVVFSAAPTNDFSYLVVSSPNLKAGTYTFYNGETQLSGTKAATAEGLGGGMRPNGNKSQQNTGEAPTPPPTDGEQPAKNPQGGRELSPPEGNFQKPPKKPDGNGEAPQKPDFGGERPTGNFTPPASDSRPSRPSTGESAAGESSNRFTLTDGANYFNNLQ